MRWLEKGIQDFAPNVQDIKKILKNLNGADRKQFLLRDSALTNLHNWFTKIFSNKDIPEDLKEEAIAPIHSWGDPLLKAMSIQNPLLGKTPFIKGLYGFNWGDVPGAEGFFHGPSESIALELGGFGKPSTLFHESGHGLDHKGYFHPDHIKWLKTQIENPENSSLPYIKSLVNHVDEYVYSSPDSPYVESLADSLGMSIDDTIESIRREEMLAEDYAHSKMQEFKIPDREWFKDWHYLSDMPGKYPSSLEDIY